MVDASKQERANAGADGRGTPGQDDQIVDRLRAAFSPIAIYLLGSYAYGTPGPDSDIDLLVVVEDSELGPYKRDAMAYLALCGLGVAKDVLVYTRREFDDRATLPVSFERTVKQKGKLIYVAGGGRGASLG